MVEASYSDLPPPKRPRARETLLMTFASLGAIYGDLGTSPLYTLSSIKYKSSPPSERDILGGLSLVFWVFVLIVMFKYALVVLTLGPNNGEGGQVAIYAKIARHLNIGPKGVVIPGSSEKSDLELLQRLDTNQSFMSHYLQKARDFKHHPRVIRAVSYVILWGCFLGCSLVFSDGLLTPTTSILSAVAGIQVAQPSFTSVLAVSEVIIILLFVIQQLGSHRISIVFAPIIVLWLIGLVICGIYNIVKYEPTVFRALSPHYAIELLRTSGIDAFSGAMLAVTGTEAMFADIGHFGRVPVQIGISVVFVCLQFCYLGQGAYLIHHPDAMSNPFYLSIPGGSNSPTYWVMFMLATLSTIIASQALVLGVFSIVAQLINLDCFPRLHVKHVSASYAGKVYIPLVNFVLLVGVCCTAAGFKNSNNVTAAYGLGINLDFVVTSVLMLICMVYVYECHIVWPLIFGLVFLPLEFVILVANFKKVPHGGWFPLMVAALCFGFLAFWRFGRARIVDQQDAARVRIAELYPAFQKQSEEVDLRGRSTDRDLDEISELVLSLPEVIKSEGIDVVSRFGSSKLHTFSGVGFVHCEALVLRSPNTVPQLYHRLVSNTHSLPSVIVFCCTRTLSIPYVPTEDRVLVGSMPIPGHYKCIVRFGFMEDLYIDKHLRNHILNSIPEVDAMTKKSFAGGILEHTSVPVMHVFENNVIRSHEWVSSRNPVRWAVRACRRFLINRVFAPLEQIFQTNDEVLDTEEDAKVLIGGVVRI